VPATDPVVTFVPRPDDGPVLVTVAYRVPEDKMTDFVDAMRRVEQHRRRTGAYRWGLFRDLAAPDRFLETFVVDSWVEHLRQHGRSTTATDVLMSAVRVYIESDVAVGHFVSAFSAGALDPVEACEPIDTE
jgi:hypothetical protein